jgi:hypothetical protein
LDSQLRAELEQAEAWNVLVVVNGSKRNRSTRESTHGALGLGRRERKSGATVERARQNVRRRIADAMHRIADACPAIGRHLDIAIKSLHLQPRPMI